MIICENMRRLLFKIRGWKVGIGSYGMPKVYHWGEPSKLTIGRYCSIGPEVKVFLGGNHRVDWVSTYPFSVFIKKHRVIKGHPSTKGDVVIGNDVWIGGYSSILSGVSIGDGAVVGYASIVTRNVPPYSIVAGNPARVVRKRFRDDQIEELMRLRWWDLDFATISELVPVLLSTDIDKTIQVLRSIRLDDKCL